MTYSYYPGCTLRNKAKDLDVYARASAEVLGFTLEELENWQCCGGVYPLGADEIASKLPSVRALNAAKEKGQEKEEKQTIPLSVMLTADKIATDSIFQDGIYLDIDVELIKPIDDLLKDVDCVMGFETSNLVAPGLLMATTPHNEDLLNILNL